MKSTRDLRIRKSGRREIWYAYEQTYILPHGRECKPDNSEDNFRGDKKQNKKLTFVRFNVPEFFIEIAVIVVRVPETYVSIRS